MSTNAHGWKRLAGSVTLIIACVFAAGYARSIFYFDYIAIAVGKHNVAALQSNFGDIACIWMWESENGYAHTIYPDGVVGIVEMMDREKFVDWEGYAIEPNNTRPGFLESGFPDAHWYWKHGRFFHGVETPASGSGTAVWAFPYWSVTVPLILISVLILWSSRTLTIRETDRRSTQVN